MKIRTNEYCCNELSSLVIVLQRYNSIKFYSGVEITSKIMRSIKVYVLFFLEIDLPHETFRYFVECTKV